MFRTIFHCFVALVAISIFVISCESDRSNVVNGNDINYNIKTSSDGSIYPEDLFYTDHHEWLKIDGNDAIVGITQYAAGKFTNVTYFSGGITEDEEDVIIGGLPKKKDTTAKAKGPKIVWPILAPVGGNGLASNPLLNDDPDLMRRDPYNNGWCVRILNFNIEDLNYLMNSEDYEAYIEQIEE
jgi:glycine cleavage system H protein